MTDLSLGLFDLVLGLLLLALANRALFARELFTAILVFMGFGLVLALAWARLQAPDLALAEAAIGAGLTGALLLSALTATPPELPARHSRQRRWSGIALLILVAPLLLQSLWTLPAEAPGLGTAVREQMGRAGADNPVTAVLLNFRSWDTLLEMLVLLLALTGLRQLAPGHQVEPRPWPLLRAWGRVLAPLTVVVGGYLLWRGSSAPGGAFQAGAMIAAGAVMLRLNRVLPPLRWHYGWVRSLVLVGLVVFLLVGVVTVWLGRDWLSYPTAFSAPLILLIETVATLSIATTLTLLVVGEKDEVSP